MVAPATGLELNQWDLFQEMGWRPHAAQRRVLEDESRHRVVAAGRRFGKSEIGGHVLPVEAAFTYGVQNEYRERKKRREFWIVGPEYTDAEKEFRVCYNELSAMGVPFDKPGTYNDPIGGNLHISLWGGTFQVHGKSAKYPDTLVGEGLHGVIMAEAAKLKERIWPKYVRPMLADFDGWSIHGSTPEGKNHFYENWRRGQDPANTEWSSWRMPSWLNPYVYKKPTRSEHIDALREYMKTQAFLYGKGSGGLLTAGQIIEELNLVIDPEILGMMLDLTEEAFNQEIGADFTEFVGRVFKGFDEEVHVMDLDWHPGYDTVAAVDYGFTNPNVWLLIQIDPWGNVNVLDEVHEPGLTADEFGDEIIRRGLCPPSLSCFYPDPADPGATRILQKKLKKRARTDTGGELKHRIDAIRAALKPPKHLRHLPFDHPERLPVLRFNRSCKRTIHEMHEYRYPEKKADAPTSTLAMETPMKKDDHAPEALGRFFKGHFGTPAQKASRRRSSKAVIRR